MMINSNQASVMTVSYVLYVVLLVCNAVCVSQLPKGCIHHERDSITLDTAPNEDMGYNKCMCLRCAVLW